MIFACMNLIVNLRSEVLDLEPTRWSVGIFTRRDALPHVPSMETTRDPKVGRDAVEPITWTDGAVENYTWRKEVAAVRDVRCGSTASRPTRNGLRHRNPPA